MKLGIVHSENNIDILSNKYYIEHYFGYFDKYDDKLPIEIYQLNPHQYFLKYDLYEAIYDAEKDIIITGGGYFTYKGNKGKQALAKTFLEKPGNTKDEFWGNANYICYVNKDEYGNDYIEIHNELPLETSYSSESRYIGEKYDYYMTGNTNHNYYDIVVDNATGKIYKIEDLGMDPREITKRKLDNNIQKDGPLVKEIRKRIMKYEQQNQ